MSVSIVIPARWKSERLPGKMLADLEGKPLLWHTWKRVCGMNRADEIKIAVDTRELFEEVRSWGGDVIMTDEKCQSGTERIFSIIDQLRGDLILNVQGDECFIDPDVLDKLVERWNGCESDIITLVSRFRNIEDLMNTSNVKVVVGKDGRALYFSRSPIPYVRGVDPSEWLEKHTFWWHIGVYGYRRETLASYGKLPKSTLEEVEKLEQLRFLEAGFHIDAIEVDYHSISVDTLDELDKARKIILGDLVR